MILRIIGIIFFIAGITIIFGLLLYACYLVSPVLAGVVLGLIFFIMAILILESTEE